jgi:hypothetical protein
VRCDLLITVLAEECATLKPPDCCCVCHQTQSNINILDAKIAKLHVAFAKGEVLDRWTPGVVVPLNAPPAPSRSKPVIRA